MIELLMALGIFSIILLAIVSSLLWMNSYNKRTKADREVSENAKRALEQMSYEIRSAKSLYTPTTTATQLSLEALHYLPSGESVTFIDFFLCGDSLCLKKEGQSSVLVTPEDVRITSLSFSPIVTGSVTSIKMSLEAEYAFESGDGNSVPSVSFTSTASLRSY